MKPEQDHCGNCHACLDICPTDAFPAPYRLDARRCISYLTIEHKGPIPREFREAMGNRIYGCDDCLAVCPWNKFARAASEMKLAARDELKAPPWPSWRALDDAAFRALFRKSPVKRIGRDRFLRNVLIAIGNSGDAGLAADGQAPAGRSPRRWCAARRCGRCRDCCRRQNFDALASACAPARSRCRRCARNGLRDLSGLVQIRQALRAASAVSPPSRDLQRRLEIAARAADIAQLRAQQSRAPPAHRRRWA